jgi:hypothetical protein
MERFEVRRAIDGRNVAFRVSKDTANGSVNEAEIESSWSRRDGPEYEGNPVGHEAGPRRQVAGV